MQDANWLVDPSRRGTLTGVGAEVTEPDKQVLRALGERLATIAALPVHAETASRWSAMNALRHVKPMVWSDEVPWHEMDVDDELRLQTTSEWSRYHEWEMRKLIYQWEHMPADMVVEPVVYSPLVVHNTAFGIAEDVDIAVTDEANTAVSRHFNIQIRDEDDLEKIKVPIVTHESAASEQHYQQLREILSGVIDVHKLGANGFCFWFAPWDEMIRWGDAQADLSVGAHAGGHGRGTGGVLPIGGPQHGLRHCRRRGHRRDRRGEHGGLAALQHPDT